MLYIKPWHPLPITPKHHIRSYLKCLFSLNLSIFLGFVSNFFFLKTYLFEHLEEKTYLFGALSTFLLLLLLRIWLNKCITGSSSLPSGYTYRETWGWCYDLITLIGWGFLIIQKYKSNLKYFTDGRADKSGMSQLTLCSYGLGIA